jgi:integrase
MKTAKSDEKFPVTVAEGRVTAKIHKVTKTKNGKIYTSYVADYVLLGQRKQVVRADFDEAKQIALDACRLIAGGQQMSLTLFNGDRLAYLRATETLSPVGVALDLAASEYAAALQVLGGKISIVEACRDWVRRNMTVCPKITVAAAAEQLKTETMAEDKSVVRKKEIATVLGRLAIAFNSQVQDITPGQISIYLAALPLKERTKCNYRSIIRYFNRWLVLRGYLPKGSNWLENVQNYSARKIGKIEIYTPDELMSFLRCADKMTPFIAIGAFAGLRHAEISRLDWGEIDLDDGFIEVKAQKSKTGERRLVPVHENLKKWLLPYRQQSGPVVSYANTSKQLLKIALNASVQWKHNALRHSYISYRMAECADIPRVADEAGNSPQMIRQHYLRRVKPLLATQWFSVVPETPPNVVSLAESQKVAA